MHMQKSGVYDLLELQALQTDHAACRQMRVYVEMGAYICTCLDNTKNRLPGRRAPHMSTAPMDDAGEVGFDVVRRYRRARVGRRINKY